MATKHICSSCLRTLRQQGRSSLKRGPENIRSFSQRSLDTAEQRSRTGILGSRDTRLSTTSAAIPCSFRQFSATTSDSAQEPSAKAPPSPRPISEAHLGDYAAASFRANPTFRAVTEPYVAYGSTEGLFAACAAQCSYTVPAREASPPQEPPRTASGEDLGEGSGWWFQPKARGGLGLEVTFNSWAQVLYLHMYILTVRLRAFPAEHAKIWHQNLTDHFFYAAEDRMATWHGMSARSVRNKYLKDIYSQWRGVLFSYDEGLVRGDAVLASAVWRNVFKADAGASIADVALVTAYLRQELARLEALCDERLGMADVQFGSPGMLRGLLGGMESTAMSQPFAAADEGVKEAVRETAKA